MFQQIDFDQAGYNATMQYMTCVFINYKSVNCSNAKFHVNKNTFIGPILGKDFSITKTNKIKCLKCKVQKFH